MEYIETTESYSSLGELQSDVFFILKRFKDAGNLDVEISLDLLDLTITVTAPKEKDDA